MLLAYYHYHIIVIVILSYETLCRHIKQIKINDSITCKLSYNSIHQSGATVCVSVAYYKPASQVRNRHKPAKNHTGCHLLFLNKRRAIETGPTERQIKTVALRPSLPKRPLAAAKQRPQRCSAAAGGKTLLPRNTVQQQTSAAAVHDIV